MEPKKKILNAYGPERNLEQEITYPVSLSCEKDMIRSMPVLTASIIEENATALECKNKKNKDTYMSEMHL